MYQFTTADIAAQHVAELHRQAQASRLARSATQPRIPSRTARSTRRLSAAWARRVLDLAAARPVVS
jgi:hypothetical protein